MAPPSGVIFDGVGEQVEDHLVDAQLVKHRHAALRHVDVEFEFLIFVLAERQEDGFQVAF
jgi:hypothetical protein